MPGAGPTGCGKTSLLNALAARLPKGGELKGEVLVNSLPRGKGFRTITAYVQQVSHQKPASLDSQQLDPLFLRVHHAWCML